jgi:hypothetical protein
MEGIRSSKWNKTNIEDLNFLSNSNFIHVLILKLSSPLGKKRAKFPRGAKLGSSTVPYNKTTKPNR